MIPPLRELPVNPYQPRPVLTREQRNEQQRRFWAKFALVLSVIAVAMEAVSHICASLFFDPLPDAVTGVAYALVVFFLWFNEATLANAVLPSETPEAWTARITNPLLRWLGPRRAAGLALAGTSVSLLVAGMAAWMFLPFLPFGVFLVLSVVGILLLVPVLDFLVLLFQLRDLRRLWRAGAGVEVDTRVAIGTGFVWAAALFFLVVRPALIGHATAKALQETGQAQQKAFQTLRRLRGEQTVLDLTYRRNPPYWVSLGYKYSDTGEFPWPWTGYTWSGISDHQQARRTYFLLTGTPFESVPRPASAARQNAWGQPDDVAIEETGGYVVGRAVPGLSVDESTLQFNTDMPTETAQGTWTLAFRNDTDAPQEARADILLPPGATCHAVSLWINGVEKPAAFGSPQKVRAAYQEIAVVQRRDPLLVTMPAPGHLLAQCFPVPARGKMKIKLGITTPLVWRGTNPQNTSLSFLMPAFGPVNFEVPSRLQHTLALPRGEATDTRLMGRDIFAAHYFRVSQYATRGNGENRDAPKAGDILAPGVVRMDNPLAFPDEPIDLWLVLDASEGMNGLTEQVQSAVQSTPLPAGSRIHFADTISGAESGFVLFQPGTTWRNTNYAGGTDPAPALARALQQARTTSKNPSVVVFLHADSPANVSDLDAVRRELQKSARSNGPALVSVQLAPRAQDAVAMDLAGFPSVHTVRALPGDDQGLQNAVRYAAQAAVLQRAGSRFLPVSGHAPAVNGVAFTQNAPAPIALSHLYQASATTEGWFVSNLMGDASKALDARIEAGRPAAAARLVTPLSSAVVLETKAQYKKHGLDDKDGKKGFDKAKEAINPNAAAAAPEPATILLLLTGVGAIPFLRRRGCLRQ